MMMKRDAGLMKHHHHKRCRLDDDDAEAGDADDVDARDEAEPSSRPQDYGITFGTPHARANLQVNWGLYQVNWGLLG